MYDYYEAATLFQLAVRAGFTQELESQKVSGNLVPIMTTRPFPWTANVGSEIRWDSTSSRYVAADYPMVFFDSHQQVGAYLDEVDTAYNRLVEANLRAGLPTPLTLRIPSFHSQYEVVLPLFDLIESLSSEGVTLQRIGIGKSSTDLPIIQPNGDDGPALTVGSRYELRIAYDLGEVVPPILRWSETPVRRLRGYEFKLTLLGQQAKLQTSCLIFSAETNGSYGRNQSDPGLPPLPLIDNTGYSFDSLVQEPGALGEVLERVVGPLNVAFEENGSFRAIRELGAIYMDMTMAFIPRYLSQDQLLDFIVSAMVMERWANKEL